MKYSMPKLEEMSLREKINQTIVIQMQKGQSVDFAPGAAFFFGQIITEADEAGLDELRGYVKELSDPTVAAIASREAAEIFGLEVIDHDINESKSNTTRFAVFSRAEHKHTPTDSGVHSIILFTVKHEAGALATALDILGKHNFNLRTLRSRPMKELMWQYYFYVEAEGNAHSKEGKRLLEDLEDYCDTVKFVGTFVK